MPHWLSANNAEYRSIHTITPFRFTNQQGHVITDKEVAGKIYVASFFFTKCGSICPRMMENLQTVATAYINNPDVLLLSHSVTPDMDSVPQLAHYALEHRINSKQWWLLTGNKDSIYQLARRSYFADEETGYAKDSKSFLHTENAVLIDRKGRIRGVYNATLPLEMQKLTEDIQWLLSNED